MRFGAVKATTLTTWITGDFMNIKDIIKQVPKNETIAVRLCGEDGKEKYVISRQNNISPRKYKLYEVKGEELVFAGKTALSPLELEEETGY